MISQRTKDAMAAARARGVQLGGHRAQSDITKAEAQQRAESLRGVFEGLSALSATKAAEELNRRGVPTAAGGKWQALQVIRVRKRLAP
jgi:DNA invertase Pin-like site-specific DNA recombinase